VRPVRIALLAPRFHPFLGGVETHVRELATRFAASGHGVDVLVHGDDALPAVEILDGVTVRRFPVLRRSQHYAISTQLYSYLRRDLSVYDVVHIHSYHATPAPVAYAARARGYVFTPHYHGTGHSPFRAALHVPYRLVGHRLMRGASAVICVTAAEAALVAKHFPGVAARTSVISNGVDVEGIEAARPYGLGRRVVLNVGRLETYKRIDVALRAFDELGEDYLMRVIGRGPDHDRLAELAASLRHADDVAILTDVGTSELQRWYRTASVYVALSRNEAQSIGTLEAAAARSGIVASDIPAHREIASRVRGIELVPLTAGPRDVAAAIRRAGSTMSARIPTWDDAARATLDVYADVVHGRQGAVGSSGPVQR
jgi:1,2-diacylglycerol 3-alpha-glucosyltransferase